METLEGMETRHSIRGFKPDPIPRDVMEKILKTVSNTPSFTNTQPWEVAVVCREKKDELSSIILDLAKTNAPTNPDLPMPTDWPPEHEARTREHGARRLATLGIERGDEKGREKLRLMNFEFYGAPCAVFLLVDGSLGAWSIFDVGLFAQSFILAAHSLGVASCLQASVTRYAPEIKRFLGVPETKKVIICISLGYADEEATLNAYRSIKLKPEDFTRWYL